MSGFVKTALTAALLGMACLASSAFGASAQANAYNSANRLYAEGKYEAALELYNSIDAANPDLEYNRAAAYLKSGKIGKAALHFNRALRLRPGDEDTIANLEHIGSIKADSETPVERGMTAKGASAVVNALSLRTMSLIALALYFALTFLIFGIILSFDSERKRKLVRYMIPVAAVTVIWFVLTGVRIYHLERTDQAVAVAQTVDAYASPSDDTAKVFTFHEGTKVTLGRVDGNYVFVTLSSGYSGWAGRSKLERI